MPNGILSQNSIGGDFTIKFTTYTIENHSLKWLFLLCKSSESFQATLYDINVIDPWSKLVNFLYIYIWNGIFRFLETQVSQ